MTEQFTPEDAYRLHVEQVSGEGSVLPKPFLELSDMAIQMYEIEADLLNRKSTSENPDVTL